MSSVYQPLYAQLKPGPGLSSKEVFAHQRARLQGAMVELVAEHGYEGVAVRSLASSAGVSTRSFYKLFPNVEECFASTYESLMQRSLRHARRVQRGSGDWEEAIRVSLSSLVDDIASHPKAAQLVLVEAFAAGPAMQTRMRSAIAGFERLLADSLAVAPEQAPVSRQIARGIAAGVMRVARTRLLAGGRDDSAEVADQLVGWALSLLREHAAGLELTDRQIFDSTLPRYSDATREDREASRLGAVDEEGRIFAAVAKLGITCGFSELTIPRIRAEAGVSRRSFDARFAGVGDCFLEAIEATAAFVAARAERNAHRANSWEGGTYSGIRALCTELAHNPTLARLAFLDILAPGREGLQRRERLVSLGANRLSTAPPPDRQPSDLVAEASIGAAWRIAHADVATGRARELPRLAPILTYVTLAPAIGAAAATEAIRDGQMRSPAH